MSLLHTDSNLRSRRSGSCGLKIEINTREHFTVLGLTEHQLNISNPWFTGAANLKTYQLDELLGTKLRALYQRRKSRDLFDLWALP